MKKLIMALAMTLSLSAAVSASAATTLDASDTLTFINGYAIQSLKADGATWVDTEDLRDFGFRVDYDDNARSLYINFSEKYFSNLIAEKWALNAAGVPNGPAWQATIAENFAAYANVPGTTVATTAMANIVASDIKVYMAGKQVDAYCVDLTYDPNDNASMWVKFADLTKVNDPNYGITYDWSPSYRQENITITPYGYISEVTFNGMMALKNSNGWKAGTDLNAKVWTVPVGTMTLERAYELASNYLALNYHNVVLDSDILVANKYFPVAENTSFTFSGSDIYVDGNNTIGGVVTVGYDEYGRVQIADNFPVWVELIYGK